MKSETPKHNPLSRDDDSDQLLSNQKSIREDLFDTRRYSKAIPEGPSVDLGSNTYKTPKTQQLKD